MLMSKVDKYSLGYAIGNSIQENKDKIAKLEKKNKRLQEKLEKKDKIIDEMLNFASFDFYCPYECFCDEEQDECDKVKKICDCEICKDDYKKCWLKYFENKAKAIKNE